MHSTGTLYYMPVTFQLIEHLASQAHPPGETLSHLEGLAFFDKLTPIHLKGFVRQLRPDASAHIMVGLVFVLVQHIDDTAVILLCQHHQLFHNLRCLYGIVYVRHQVLYAIYDDNIRMQVVDRYLHKFSSRLVTQSAKIVGIEAVVKVINLPCHRDDSLQHNLLRTLLALLGVEPQYA